MLLKLELFCRRQSTPHPAFENGEQNNKKLQASVWMIWRAPMLWTRRNLCRRQYKFYIFPQRMSLWILHGRHPSRGRWLQVSVTTKGKLGCLKGPLFQAQTAHWFIFEPVYMSTCLPADNVGQRKPIPHVAVSLPACLPVSRHCCFPLLQSVMPLINSGS